MASAPTMLGNVPTIIATGTVYAPYIAAARQNLEDLLQLTQRLRDPAFEREAQRMLDCFDSTSTDALAMIDEAEVNCAPRRAMPTAPAFAASPSSRCASRPAGLQSVSQGKAA